MWNREPFSFWFWLFPLGLLFLWVSSSPRVKDRFNFVLDLCRGFCVVHPPTVLRVLRDFGWFIRHLISVVKSVTLKKSGYPQVQGSIPAVIQAHAYADLRYAWSVQKYGVCFKRPFFERPSIVHPTYWLFVFGSVETVQNDACCVGVLQKNWTAYLCRVQSCTKCADIHCIQRPPFVQTIHHLYLNSADHKGRDTGNNKMEQRSQELDWDMHMLWMQALSASILRTWRT